MVTSQQTGAFEASFSPIRRQPARTRLAIALLLITVGCGSEARSTPEVASAPASTTQPAPTTAAPAPTAETPATTQSTASATETTSATNDALALPERPQWLGKTDLSPEDDSIAIGLETPPELTDRRFATIDRLPPPDPDAGFVSSVQPLSEEILEASTWTEGCPVGPEDLRYLTLTFWGFDDRPHTGDMIVHAEVAQDVVSVFAELYEARFPIEEMRIITPADLAAPQSGDGNVTAAFVCRAARGSSRFSEHAYGLAIDINPFHNPYRRGEVLLPELARHYLPRDLGAPGQIVEGDVVTTAFERIGWKWGGNWNSLVDYQHFSLNNR